MFIKYFLYTTSLALMAACNSMPEQNTASTDSPAVTAPQTDNGSTTRKLCFMQLSGATKQDTLYVHLDINHENVTGEMNHIIHEKDARRGMLQGKIAGDGIIATWRFMQEGMHDTIQLQLRVEPGQLTQKPLIFDHKTGRQHTDTSAGYSVVIPQVDCLEMK